MAWIIHETAGYGVRMKRSVRTALPGIVPVCVTCVITEGFEAESFPLKYNPMISEYKIHSIIVDIISSS